MDIKAIIKDVESVLNYRYSMSIGMDQLDKMQLAFLKLFDHTYDTRGIAAFKSIRDAYVSYSGNSDIDGRFKPENVSEGLRSCMSFNSGSFAYGLQNALSMYLSKMYKDLPFHEDIFISDKKNAKNFRTIHSVQLGYLEDLPGIDPEASDYDDIAPYADTEAQYDISTKGAILWVTRTHIMNDSIELIQGMVNRASRAARKTHARYVWNFYLNNATCPDGTAWFTSGHGNLGSNALDFTSLVTGITALANMTEPNPSAEKIGIDFESFNWHLVIPIDLWDLAVKKNQSDSYFTGNDLTTKVPNPCHKLFGERNERIITCPFSTDVNDWGIIRGKEDVPIVEMSYLFGHEDPEFIIESGPQEEHVLTSDKIGYKIRHEYGGTLADYRGGYKASV